jgi:hypothetical protein
MRKSVVAGITLVGAAVLVALVLLLARGDAPIRLKLSSPRSDHADAPEHTAPALVPFAPASRPPDQIRPTAYVDPELAATRAAPDTDLLRVLVVDDSTGLPVPEAEVAGADEGTHPPPRIGFYSAPSTLVTDFDHAPQRVLANERGIAVIRTSEKLVVAARKGPLFGLRKFKQAPRGEIRVVMVPGPFVAAKVVTETGAPAPGVAVTFQLRRKKGGSSSASAVTILSRAPDGLAIAHHPGVSRDEASSIASAVGDINEVTATLDGAGPKEGVKATADQLKEGPITLVLAATGTLVVKLADGEGKPFLPEARVTLTASRGQKVRSVTFELPTAGGTAEFPFVPVGAVLSVSAEFGELDSVRREKFDSLKTSGERLTVELRFGKRRATVKGRAVDENGAPLGRRTLNVDLVSGPVLVLPATLSVDTDAAGEFKIQLDRQNSASKDAQLFFEIRAGPDAVERHAIVALPKLSDADETALGDVRLPAPEPFATGFVRDELGAPLGGALVTTEAMTSRGFPGETFTVGPRNVGGHDAFRARTDEFGAFRIPKPARSQGRVTSFGLKAELPGYVCTGPAAGLKSGAQDVVIVLSGAGVIEGRLVLPDPAPVRRLTASVTLTAPAAASAVTSYRFEDRVDSDGRFQLPGIHPGVATVEIRMAGASEPLASIADVTVPRLGTSDDARLRAIDLREHPLLRP